MEGKKKVPVYEGMEQVLAMVKQNTVVAEIGKTSDWISKRQNRNKSNPNGQVCRSYSRGDVDLLNHAIWNIGQRLLSVRIAFSEDRQAMGEQVRKAFSEVKSAYVFGECMGKKVWWIKNMKRDNKYMFSFDDILKMNYYINGIGEHLIGMELYYTDPDESPSGQSEADIEK